MIGQCTCIVTLIHKHTVRTYDRFHGGRGGLTEIGAPRGRPCSTERGQKGVERSNHDVHVIIGECGTVVETVNGLGHLIGMEIK